MDCLPCFYDGGVLMAIDPATIKVALKAAMVALKKENRQNLWIVIMVALGSVAFVLLLLIYILTSPLSILGSFFNTGELSNIEGFKVQHDDKVLIMGGKLEWHGNYPLPMQNATLTSDYGSRTDPVTGLGSEFHKGIDLSAYWQAPVMSIADGIVETVNTEINGYGNYIIIRHETGTETFYSMYAHLHDIFVFEGQSVKQGAVIGRQGGDPVKDKNPGRSNGSHLHFEIRKTPYDGSQVDPKLYLYAQKDKGSEDK